MNTFIRLRQLRLDRNVTQQQIADFLKTTKNSISNWELGKTEPDINSIKTLANYFDVSTDYLLNRTDDPRPFPLEDLRTIDEKLNSDKFAIDIYNKSKNLSPQLKDEVLRYIDYLKSRDAD